MQNLKRTLLIIASACSCVALQGCFTTAALLQSDQALSLEPEPDRHFKMTGVVEGPDRSEPIEFAWSCEQTRYFTAATMSWRLKWHNASQDYLVRELKNGDLIFTSIPYDRYCEITTPTELNKGLGIITREDPDSITITSFKQANPKLLLKGVVERIINPENNLPLNEAERKLDRSLRNEFPGFATASVSVRRQTQWSQNASLKNTLDGIRHSTTARQWGEANGPVKNWSSFFPDHKSMRPLPEATVSFYAKPTNGKLELHADGTTDFRIASSFHRITGEAWPPITICVVDDCLTTYDANSTLYFATAKLLVTVYATAFHRVHVP
jgi:hypothetical protein